jgi:GNAT superfamily N-acetyltransferase
MNEELKKLYDAIASRGFYTKSYDEFVNQYQDPAYRDKVFAVVTREGLYTKGRNEFDAKYSAAPLKKKEPSVSTSQEGAMAPATEAGSLASQESAPVLDFTKLRQEQQAQQFGELPAQPQAEPAMPPSPQLQQQVMGRMASPKSKTVETTRADGTPVTVQFGPTEFKSSDEAPMPQFKTFSEMAGQVDATIDEPTKQKISQAIGITGAVFNKIVSPNASVPEAINQAKAFADNTQAAYNVGVLSGQISNNMQQSVPDKERIAKLNKELKQEQTKLLSSQMGADASDFYDMLSSNFFTFLTEVLTTSAAQMATGAGGMRPEDLAVAGILTLTTGTGGAAYMAGKNSLNAEMSSRIMGALEERGVDVTDAAQLETAMTNRDLMMEIAGEVQAPATFIAVLDALSAGMAGQIGKPIYEVLAQVAAGSIGEAGAQLIESGEITSASAVLTEAVAELPGGLLETAFGAKTKDVQRKIEINRQLKDVEAQIERTEDEDTKGVLRSVADNLRNEKNKIYDDYAAFVNSLPEEDVARLNSLNEEIVKTSKAIDQVDNAATKDALKARRSALLKQVEQLENKQPDAVQEQATDEAAVVPDEIQSLKDDEIVTFTVESLDQVPDEFRDRAEKKDGTEIEIRKTILGLPIGEKTTKVVNSGYTYTLTGKEAKDYAIQKQATDESVLRAEQPEVGLQEVGERDQEPQVAAEEEVGTVGTLLNERVVYDDPVSGQPVEGDLFVEGQRVVLEAAGGQQFDLGNVDDVLAQPLDGGIVRPAEMAIMPQEDGSFVFNKDGNQKVAKGTQMFNNQPGLQAITRDDAGNVKRVTLYSEDGTETYNLTGQEAEDAAYYIVRGFVETQEGQDAINQLAERNEEARRDLTKPIGVRPVQQVAPQAAAQVRAEAPAGPVVEGAEADVDAQELADLAADMQAATPARRERLERVADRARAAVSRILPDVKIIVHDTQEAYRAATTFEGEATYNNDTKTVHINGTKATPAAVAHEVFHAVFLDKVKTDAKAQAVAKKMVESLKRVLGENSEAYQYLDEFSKDYDANFQNEEKLAEMVAVLSELYSGVNDIGLSPSAVQSVKNAIKKFITDLAKLFNIPMATTLTDADVLAVLNTIAQKAVTGEVITEADVRTIDRVMAEDIESVESFFVNTELETPPAVEVKPRQRVSAQTNEEARESLERKGRKMFPSSTDDALTSDEVRVYFMDKDFNWLKRFSVPYEDVANVFAEMASDPDFHLFPSITMQGGFMTMDTSKGRAEMEANIKISPRDENTIYIEGIELFDPKLAGEGVGAKLMNRILAAADKFGLTIQLDAYPTRRYQYDQTKGRDFSDRQLDKMADRLVTDFYSKFGFSSLDIRTKELARFMERKPMASASSVQMRERKGLITITEREAQKYARIGINDARVAQAMEDLGLAGVKFTKGDVEAAISKAFDKAIDELKADMYNGQPAVITQDSPGITNAIQAEITALEEQGASLSRIESAKQMVNDPRTRNEYIRKYQDTQKETLAQWVSYLEQSDYDPAFKMLMLDAVVTSNYDYKLEKYFKRNSTTIRNMAPFDAGTLAELYGMTENKELLKTYAEIQADNASRVVKANMMKSTKEGKWLKFAGGDNVSEAEREVNANALSQLVQNTFWCTKTNAKSQLDGGDFYVYVTEGTDMRPIPRIAVRMDGSDVGELRGNASSKQDLEPEMLPVAEKFLKEEIPGGSGQTWLDSIAFNKKAKAFAESIDGSTLSMNMINEFAKLASESAKYNVDYGRNGFIERIEESIKAKVKAGDVTPELDGVIETSLGDANPRTKIFIGNVRRGFYDRLQNVEVVIGDVTIDGTDIAPRNLRVITGDLDLGNNIQSLSNIETVGGEIYFNNSINTLEDLGKIEVINGGYSFSPPTRVKTFDYLKTINGDFNIERSSFLESLGSLEVINGSLRAGKSDLNSLGNLKSVSSYAVLPRGVKKIDGVSFGDSLTVSDGVEIINVKTIPGDFVVYEVPGMESKHSATGSIEEIGGTALLHDSSSTSIGNIKRVGRGISLSKKITSLENLSHVNGNIGIYGDEIKSIDNLEYVGGDLTVYARKISSLGSVKHVGGNIEFSILSAVKDLGKLEYVGGLIEGAWNINDIGALSSVGELWFGKFIKNETTEALRSGDVNITTFAAGYVQESGLDGSPIAEKVYELALKQASKYFGVELPPAPRQRKDSDAAYENWKNGPKSVAQEIGYKYNMNHKGYTPSNIVKQHFKNDVERLSSRLSIRSTITGSGYYMTLDGKFFNPYLKVIGGQDSGPNGLRQRMGQPNENIFDIVTMARQKGYTDKTIEIYLKQEGFAAQDIKDAMAVNSNIDGAQVPQEFGNVTGGMAQGQTLFDEIKAKLTKMAADGASMMDIRIEAQTLLMDSEVYKAQSVEVKAQLRLSLDATIGTKAADRAFRQEFKQLRAMLSDRKKARRELETIKRMMRGFIRKNLPQGEYSKAEVVALLKAIVDVNVDTLPLVMEKVEGYVTGFKVRKLESQIKKLLATKTTKVDSGRAMGITTIDVQEDLAALDEMLIDDGMSEQNKEDLLLKHLNEYQTLSSKYDLTDKDIRDLQLLKIAIAYNEAMMLDNDNPVKVESLTLARDGMTVMITVGRSEFKAAQAAKHQAQKKNVVDLIEAITGEPVPFDIESKESIDEYVRNQKVSEANASILKSRISKVLGAFAKNPLKAYFDRSASLSGLLGQITANLTDMFGGPVSEMVYGKIKQSDIEFERGMQARSKILDSKLREIYGKDYPIYVKRNKIAGLIDIFKKERAAEARKLMEEMKTASFKRKNEIMLELSDMRVFAPLSQNQIYYLYNQFKDESNRAGLEANYGKDYVEQLNELFEKYLDPKVREWADWQANLLFPELYDVYNPVYVEIFNTNMPWTANYAGRVYREGADETEMAITIMNNKGEYSNIQTPSSTKSRKNNNRQIAEMDGDLVLDSYISDMEYFRAYGVTIRDVDRIFKNEAVQASIKKVAGEDVLKLIQDYIKIVGTNGMSVGTPMKQSLLDFVDSRLAISYMAGALNQLIKQLTSAFLFAPRIGINNWLMYTAKAAPQLGGVWNEFIDNAPRIVKRYNPKEMAKILGGYDSKRSKQLAKNGGVTDNMRVLKVIDTTGQALDALMWPVTQGDKHSAMVGAMGNYLYYKDIYTQKNPNATQDEVIKFAADKVSTEIEQVLGSSSRIDKDSFQNSGSALYRALSFLSNSPKAMIRNIIPAYTGLFKKIASFDKTAGPGTLKQNLETVLMVQVFVPVLFKWAAIALPGLWREWRDEDDEELGAAAILGPFEALLIVGPLLTFIKDQVLDKPWADDVPTLPFYDLVEDLSRQVNKIIKAETDLRR